MRKINTIELSDVGELSLFSVKENPLEFKRVNKDGIEVERKTEGYNRGVSYFVDSDGNRYNENEVFYLIGNNKIPKVKRTEKVSSYELVELTDVIGNFLSSSYYILDYSEVVMKNFERVAKGNAIKFSIKLSSVGMKWTTAYLMKFKGHLVMYCGIGYMENAIREFEKMKEAQKKSKVIHEEVIVRAEDLEKDIAKLIQI